jgi:hypothetical protein
MCLITGTDPIDDPIDAGRMWEAAIQQQARTLTRLKQRRTFDLPVVRWDFMGRAVWFHNTGQTDRTSLT